MEAIVMPALGQTSDENYIQEWLVEEGQEVEMGQPLLSVETDKAQLEVECVADGTLLKIVAPAGSTVSAGTVIAYIGDEGEAVPQ
ncbi:biotin/lipoyl-containing protein [Sinomonas sp.]|jgi:pyruvate/2-oxoglutarate dehydrogenase complex dihydrolipoamide acyltransferase (E2) component|uniref:biotin/lipoyl-containing protein n=1 Tax=Sinomonas sp. TaxID=1914986 RepID=UPI002FE01A78